MHKILALMLVFNGIQSGTNLSAQVVTIDPVLTAGIAVANGIETSNLNDMKGNQNAIIAAQAATTLLVAKINQLQEKTLDGLTYVSTVVKNAYQLVRAYKIIQNIYRYQSKMLNECIKDPLATILAFRVEKEMVEKAISSYTQIATLILKEGTDNLMDSGDRTKLLFTIITDLEVIEGFSFQAYYTVHLAVMNGVFNSLNPFNQFVNNDRRIIKEILNTWKF